MPIGRDRRSPQSSNLLGLRTTANQQVASGVFWSVKVGHTPRTRVRGSSLDIERLIDDKLNGHQMIDSAHGVLSAGMYNTSRAHRSD
ncbi:hypothetical protein EVAR_33231_1 [Eumeta japonica]|uniref:Uncharacterized protein n=1 Tax=Eumeta variegata TaxID=151549 RepID=A0A4C1W0Q9_EUMVA|nr:hypothetical protein EVAR_33231_1 [Eumeta japonica]